jgi:hypothetical protein
VMVFISDVLQPYKMFRAHVVMASSSLLLDELASGRRDFESCRLRCACGPPAKVNRVPAKSLRRRHFCPLNGRFFRVGFIL